VSDWCCTYFTASPIAPVTWTDLLPDALQYANPFVFLRMSNVQMCIVLDLPEVISRGIIAEWVWLPHVARLDSAYCSGSLRARFRSLAFGHSTSFETRTLRYRTRTEPTLLLHWALFRTCRLDGMLLDERISECQWPLRLFLVMSGSSVRWLHYRSYGSGCTAQNILLVAAKWCPNVHELRLSCRAREVLWDDSLVTLSETWQKLTDLSLRNVPISNLSLITVLHNCKGLECLAFLSENEQPPVDIALPTLKSLSIIIPKMCDTLLFAISGRCTKLKTLNVFRSSSEDQRHQVTDAGVLAVLNGCPQLEAVDVEYAVGISHGLRTQLAKQCNFQRFKSRRWCEMNEGLAQSVFRVCPQLTRLECGDEGWLTDATLVVCAQCCPLLEKIVLIRCWAVTNNGVCALVSAAGDRLRSVTFWQCPQVNDEAVLAVAEHCPQLTRFCCHPQAGVAAMVTLYSRCAHLKREPQDRSCTELIYQLWYTVLFSAMVGGLYICYFRLYTTL
jgi:hypothetical protein